MLKDEIDKIENVEQIDKFLEGTNCGYLLGQLQKMPDIQIFFKNVILKTVTKIETNCSSREITFKVLEKELEYLNLKQVIEKKGKNNKNIDDLYDKLSYVDQSINNTKEESYKRAEELGQIFMIKYAPDINIKEFKELSEKAKKENKNDLFEYFNKFVNDIKSKGNGDLYSNKTLMKNFFNSKFSQQLLTLYQNDFLDIISFIDQLIKDLIQNILLLPNSIKYICKIISILIRNKFKDIKKYEENAFISKFIFGKLLKPIISFPSFKALISDFVISGNTLKNIKVVNFILSKLFSGKLFLNNSTEGDYSPFNWLFLEKMENILFFFEKAINIKLPEFIEKYINNELPNDYKYEFFNENKEEIYTNISICFSRDNLYHLIKGMEKCQNIFNDKDDPIIKKLKSCFDRLKKEESLKEIIEIDENILSNHKDKIKKKEKEKYKDKEKQEIIMENFFIYNSQEIGNKYKKLFSINNRIANFYIDIKNEEKKKKLDEKEKNIIKVKNYLCSSLGNYRLLNKSDFNIGTTSDTKKMLNEIKLYMSLPNFILSNNTIPSTWYINSILELLNKIPEEYKENDYKKLFEELTQNLNDSISMLDFEKLILFRNKIKFIDKMNNYYENVKELMDNININEQVKQIAEEMYIPVDINFDFEEKKFVLEKSNIKEKLFEDKNIYEDTKKNLISFKTIEAFTRYFPNLAKYQKFQDINTIDLIKEFSINQSINKYFEIIKKELIKKPEIKQHENIYKEKIKDYIMDKIYDKIYPPEPHEKDNEIFKKTIRLSWVEPNLFVSKDYIYDNLLPDILNEFKRINNVKSPFKKLKCIKKIMNYIDYLIRFNETIDKEVGADDISPVLNYVFIKAQPYKIYTDLEFIGLFLEDNGVNDNDLNNFKSMSMLIIETQAKDFNLSVEEYKKKCDNAVNEDNNVYIK